MSHQTRSLYLELKYKHLL